MESPIFTPASELRSLIRDKELSAVEVTEAVLARLEEVNPLLNAVVAVRAEGALADARAADAKPPEEHGPLHGIPFTVKDANEAADLPVAYGSLPFTGYRPGFDSEVVARLRRAGGILIGSTNMPEFGLRITTENRAFPATRNPWNTAYGPAGSSGGAAAAVAAGIAPLALAADGAGSGRAPASACGIVGLKPTRGRTPWAPATQEQWAGYVVNGQMARTVRDAALMLDATAGPVAGEPYGLPGPSGSFLAACDRPPERLRVAYTATPPHGTVVPEVREIFERAVSVFADLGAETVEASPDLGGLLDPLLTVIAANVAAMVRGVPRERLSELEPTTLDVALHGERLGAADYSSAVAAAQSRAAGIIRFWTRFDVLLTPTLTVLPPPLGTAPAGQGFTERWREYADWLAFAYPFNITGQPAISLPAGRAARNLPVGVQLVGAPGAEARLLGLAAAFERARPWADEPPRLG
ncbi:6-aminohexanoate-cyclic-dimer hydrolase [Streptomyces inusitatus]|uniref:6-aminohexanoate-cyclic-dimer hydrolase n=1 Tax=Streptomyces inusitatus TaxID=68221 RepID=A0A918QBM0_9ACTN|nr:amidase [Streptomyces inusitatus]GGZ38423.1 6-aminohexanoate-cyclic-dimer hydrolase [Streptomyces inusitatus]